MAIRPLTMMLAITLLLAMGSSVVPAQNAPPAAAPLFAEMRWRRSGRTAAAAPSRPPAIRASPTSST